MIVSVIVPTYNEEKYIVECLDSVLDFNYPKEKLEIIIVDGQSTDKTKEIINSAYLSKHQNIKLLNNPSRTQPYAFNIGIKASSGDFIIIIGAHASYDKDFIKNLVDWHNKVYAMNIGGAITTAVRNKTKKTQAIIKVLSSRFGVGNATFRLGVSEIREVDTVAYGCYRKECFEKYGLFNEKLSRNQDIELNKRIVNGGDKIFLVPNVQCTYFARETYLGLAKNNFGNGMWNILTVYYTKDFNSLSLRHFIPLIFILSLIIPGILSFLWIWFLILNGFSFTMYLMLISLISIKLKDRQTSFFHLISAFICLHIPYGIGSLIGIFKIPSRIILKK